MINEWLMTKSLQLLSFGLRASSSFVLRHSSFSLHLGVLPSAGGRSLSAAAHDPGQNFQDSIDFITRRISRQAEACRRESLLDGKPQGQKHVGGFRSEERRVGKDGRARWTGY